MTKRVFGWFSRIFGAAPLAAALFAALAPGEADAAPTATVVWESDFDTATKTGTDDNSYTIELNDNTVTDGNIVIASGASKGAIVNTSAANASSMTVLIKYTSAPSPSASVVPASIYCYRTSGSIPDVGMVTYRANDYNNYACWYVQSGSREFNSTDGTDPVMSASGGYLMMSYDCATLRVYAGNTIAALAGGAKAYAWGSSKMNYVGLGGPTGKTNGLQWNAWGGMVIDKVAIFPGNAYSNTDLADYVWPSAEKYQKWSYGSRILTWKTPSNAAGNNQDFIAYNDATYDIFDTVAGSDSGTPASNGNNSSSLAYWKTFCFGQTGYSAPGNILRLAGDYYKGVHGKFSPMTLGGLIVESGATGYSFPDEGTRSAALGDPTGVAETWFEINEDFTISRKGGVALMGTVNLDIASGKTLTFSSAAKMMQVASVDTSTAPQLPYATTVGGTLKLHGSGKLAAALNASGGALDFSDQPTASADTTASYIQGTVTVDGDTVIALPAGATFPYFIATGLSGVLDAKTGVTIGGVTFPNYVAMSDGSIIYSAPAEVTISSDATWGSGALEGWTTDDATKIYTINVTSDATLTLGSAVSLNRLTLNVSEGVTLTISGGYTITAADCIYVTGGGEVATSTAPTFSGTVKGDGTLYYNGVRPTTTGSDVVLTDSDWSGTVRITYNKENTATSTARQLFPQHWGSVNSKIKWNGVCGYFGGTTSKAGWVLEDLTVESTTYPALRKNDGGSSATDTVPSLSGSGTFADESNPTEIFKFADASEFNGAINITSSANNGMHVQFGATAVTKQARTITVLSGASVAVPAGKTWAAPGGIVVNGTLTVPSSATLTGAISGSGTIVANQQFPVPGSSFTGTLTINGDPVSGTTTDATAIYGSTLNVASGQVGVTGNVTTLPDTINIASGAYFVVMNGSLESLSLGIGTWDGSLVFMNCTSLASLTIDAGTKRSFAGTGLGSITLPTGTTLTTVNIVLDEVKGEGGTITLTSATGLTAVEGRTYNFTVNRVDGTTVTGTYDSTTSTITYTPSISGAATDIDWDFTDGDGSSFEQAPSGASVGQDSTLTYTNATDATYTGVYIKHHPYVNGAASFMGNNSAAMTVAVVGTMPATSNTIFLNVGSAYAQQYGLVFVTTAKANEVLIGYNYGGTVTPITTMTVPNSSTARHSYIVTKEDGDSTTTFTVYLDGIKWKTVTTASKIVFASLNSGVQVGSDFGGNIRDAGTYSAASDDVGVLNVLRVYGRIITEAEIAVYASTFPYVSPNGASSRTFATAAEVWVEATDTDWTNTDSSGTTTQGTTPSAGASVTVTADETTKITVNLASDTQYEALTINGSATTLAANSGSGKISVTGMTVIGAPVTVEYGAADFTGGPMTITEDGSITFDYSGYDASAVYAATDVPLTSDVDEDATKVLLIRPVTSYRTYELVYTSGHYVLRITPIANPGSVVYYTGGYWGATETTFSVTNSSGDATIVFPGDTVVIPAYYDGTSAYFGGTLPANVAAISVAKNFAFESGVDNTAILGGATVAVADGCTLSFATSWHNLTLGSVTFNGPGGVTIPSLSRTASISGVIAGTAALTISGTVNVASGGSIANTLAGSGTLAFAAVPSSALTFDDWTGTVQLPAITSGAIIFNNYGTTGSTVYLTSMSDAWIQADNTTINPKLYLAGNMTLSTMSQKTYTFAEIDGPGDLSFATSDNQPTAINITKVAEGYSGTITSTLANPVAITTLAREAGTSTAAGAKLLDTGNATSVTVGAVTIGGEAAELDLVYKDDGVYAAKLINANDEEAGYIEATSNGQTTYYVAYVTNTASSVTIPALANMLVITAPEATANIVLSVGSSINGVELIYGTDANGALDTTCEIANGAFTITTVSATAESAGSVSVALNANGSYSYWPEGGTALVTHSVAPTVATTSPMTLGADAVPTFSVETIPGLWYAVVSGTDTAPVDAVGTPVRATSSETTSLTAASAPSSGVLYYKIVVGVSKAAVEAAAAAEP